MPLTSHGVNAGCRLDVGGKLLTNTLKEQLSFRQWNMMDETHVVNHVKETCCYVARDFARDLEACRCVTVLACLCLFLINKRNNKMDILQGKPDEPDRTGVRPA